MNRNTIFCMVELGDKVDMRRVTVDVRLRTMSMHDINSLMLQFAKKNSLWKDALKGAARASFLDEATMEAIIIMDGKLFAILDK